MSTTWHYDFPPIDFTVAPTTPVAAHEWRGMMLNVAGYTRMPRQATLVGTLYDVPLLMVEPRERCTREDILRWRELAFRERVEPEPPLMITPWAFSELQAEAVGETLTPDHLGAACRALNAWDAPESEIVLDLVETLTGRRG